MIRITSIDQGVAGDDTFIIRFIATDDHKTFFREFYSRGKSGVKAFDDETVLRMFLQTIPSKILLPYLAEIAGKRLAREPD